MRAINLIWDKGWIVETKLGWFPIPGTKDESLEYLRAAAEDEIAYQHGKYVKGLPLFIRKIP